MVERLGGGSLALCLLGGLFGVAGCLLANPGFDGPAGESSTSLAPTTGDAAPDATTTTSATSDGPGSSSLGEATSGALTTADATGSSSGTTGAPMFPDPLVIEAEVATCVLLAADPQPYLGPDDCEGVAYVLNDTQQTGLVVVDQALVNGGGNGRPARAYLRFPLPPGLADATIAGVVLELQVADGASATGDSGRLVRVDPFDLDTLLAGPPAELEELAPSLGTVPIGATVTWDVDPAFVTGDTLFLGLLPVAGDTVVYHGHRSSIIRPRLVIDFP